MKIDKWYVLQTEIYGEVPVGYVKDKDARDAMRGNKLEDEEESIIYGKILKSFFYTYRMWLGEADPDAFNQFKRGFDSPATIWLYFVFVVTTGILMIVLLNIIIAIMGEA